MQPSKPLSPGEIYYDEDLGIELVAVPSKTCRHPDSNELICVYRSGCEHGTGCYRSSLDSTSCTYPSCSTRPSNSRSL